MIIKNGKICAIDAVKTDETLSGNGRQDSPLGLGKKFTETVKELVTCKQDKLIEGDYIDISDDNVISVTDTKPMFFDSETMNVTEDEEKIVIGAKQITKLSSLENDTGFITSAVLPTKVSELENDTGFITSDDLPTKVSELDNDTGYITSDDLPTKVSELENDSNYITVSAVDEKLSKFGGFVIAEPTGEDKHPDVETPNSKMIYLVKATESKVDNYKEWIWNVEGDTHKWILIGDTTISLDGYATEDWVIDQGYQLSADMSAYYKKTETSGSDELVSAFSAKQDKFTVGTDLKLEDGILSVNTTSRIEGENSQDYHAFVEGSNNVASNYDAHAEGNGTIAAGAQSHAEGSLTKAEGSAAHAEGSYTRALDKWSHTEGLGGIAFNECDHIEGFQLNPYASNGAGGFYNSNKVRFNNDWNFRIRDNYSFPGDLADFITIFKDLFYVSHEYNTANEFHTAAGYGQLHDPKLYKIIDIEKKDYTETSPGQIELTIDGTIESESGGIYLLGPTFPYLLTGSSGSIPYSDTEIKISEFEFSSLGFPGNYNLNNLKMDYLVLGVSGGYSKIGESSSIPLTKTLKIKSITKNESTNKYIIESETPIVISSAAGGGFGVYLYQVGPTYYGANHIEGMNNYVNEAHASHVEGYCNAVTNNAGHAEGGHTLAGGSYSHAEGYETKATGQGTHAEGGNTLARGQWSHAEGCYTSALGLYSHAEGYMTSTQGNSSHTEGYGTKTIGQESHAEGGNTLARGQWSHAEGSNTSAIGYGSHAEGGYTSTLQWCAHAEGGNTLAGGSYSHAEGCYTSALGLYSHAEGYQTKATDSYAHAEGVFTVASNIAHAEGQSTSALKQCSHSEGLQTIANGDESHSEGWGSSAMGNYSHAEGRDTLTNNECSHAEGYETKAIGQCSHAEGGHTLAGGSYSHAEGYKSIAGDMYTHAQGCETSALRFCSDSYGYHTLASADYAHAAGSNTIADKECEFVVGKYNTTAVNYTATPTFVVGNGTNTERSNAFMVFDDGTISAKNIRGNSVLELTDGTLDGESSVSYDLKPGEFVDFGQINENITELTINVPTKETGIVREVACQFSVISDTFNCILVCEDNLYHTNWPDVFENGKVYQITVVNNCVSVGIFE